MRANLGQNFFRDCPYNVLLARNNKISYLIGFIPQNNGILVAQSQGYGSEKNKPIRESDALLAALEYWAIGCDIKKLYVLPQFRHFWNCVSLILERNKIMIGQLQEEILNGLMIH